MMTIPWQRMDSVARQTKRRLFAGTRRSVKIARHGVRNAAVQAALSLRKMPRRLWNLRKPFVRWRHRTHRMQEQLQAYRAEWRVEREIERVVSGSEPLIVGPWTSEVGYEVLYWVPFVRWVKAAFRIDPNRMMVVSRGGAASWYADITPNYVDICDELDPMEFAARNIERSAGEQTNKQFVVSDLDRLLIERATDRVGGRARVLHPSLMYLLFKQFWSGHRPLGYLDSHTRHIRLAPPRLDLSALSLPAEYIAVKLYSARSLPDTPGNRQLLRTLVEALAERCAVVLLDTGLDHDEHADYAFRHGNRIISARPYLDPRTNLAVQTQIIAGARAFVGTCGSLAWLAPMLGVDTTAIFTDARFLHAHLYAARRIYHVLGAGAFSPLDLSALNPLGLTVMPDVARTLSGPRGAAGQPQPLS